MQAILAETGTDMSHWPSVKHFCSWLGLAPQHKISGGKVLSRHVRATFATVVVLRSQLDRLDYESPFQSSQDVSDLGKLVRMAWWQLRNN